MRLIDDPGVDRIASIFSEHGVDVLVVGGATRDRLLDRPAKDLDLCCSAPPETIKRLLSPLGTTYEQGERFGTIGVHIDGHGDYEVTTFRGETYTPGSRNPAVTFDVDLHEDLARRDLTINAIAWNPRTGQIVDPFGGTHDLEAGLLRTPGDPGDRFREDPLRIARVARFAVTLGFNTHPDTAAAAAEHAELMGGISRERRHAEVTRMLSCSRDGAFSTMLSQSASLNLDRHLFGQLDVAAARVTFVSDPGPDARLPAICWVTGSHAAKELHGLKFHNDEIKWASRVADAATYLTQVVSVADARRVCRGFTDPELDAALRVTQSAGRDISNQYLSLDDQSRVQSRGPLPVNGDDLVASGLKGPAVGKALRAVEDSFLQDPSLSRETALRITRNV